MDELTYLTREEWEFLISKVESVRDRALFTVMYWRGLRASEMGLIRRSDIGTSNWRIQIRRLKKSEGGLKGLCREEIAALKAWLASPECTHMEHGRVFTITRGHIFRLFRDYAVKAGLAPEKRHPHVLKHSIATRLLDEGLGIEDVQRWLGHKDIRNTMIYAKVTSKRQREAEQRIYDLI